MALSLGLTAAAKSAGAQTAEQKVKDKAVNKVEMTTVQNQEKNCVVIDSTDFEEIISEKDVNKAKKLLDKCAKKYDWDNDVINSILSNEYPDQEHLIVETYAKDMKRGVDKINGRKFPYPVAKHRIITVFTSEYSKKLGDVPNDMNTIINAKDVLEKSGLVLKDPMSKKFLLHHDFNDLSKVNLCTHGYTVAMHIDPKTGKLDGASTITVGKGKNAKVVASLIYKNGKFISGKANDKPIKKVNNTKNLAIKKALSQRGK